MNRIEQMQTVQTEALELFRRKNTGYGDAFAELGVVGVMIRMHEKFKRFLSVSNNGINLIDSETLRDTLIDINNYSSMAIMLMDEEKSILPDLIKEETNLYNKHEVDESIDLTDEIEAGPFPTTTSEMRDAYIKSFEDNKGTDIYTVDAE